VALAGGKARCDLLDLLKKTLPRRSYRVLFDDTGMEFFDTYNVVKKTQQQCAEDGIPFYIAKSHLNPEESWKLFGPPARVLRWCCSVHKSTPHTLKLREVTGKNNFIGLNFVGVRAHESIARSTYEFENYGKKQRGQFSHNSILDWTSAEVWLYVYANNLLINEAYKKGNRRVGCLLCPMSGGATNCLRRMNYPAEVAGYIDLIKNAYNGDEHKIESCGGWCARKSGRDLSNNVLRCVEKIADGVMTITVIDPTSDWSEWIKTLGNLRGNNGNCSVQFKGESINFSVNSSENGYVVTIPEAAVKKRPTFRKIFRQVFRKASYCKCCRVCEANCRNGCISFTDGKVKISDCTGCRECHAISNGCLLFNSLRQSKISDKNQKEKRGK
jgi:phosphoadenosine phosphosulfate reductase